MTKTIFITGVTAGIGAAAARKFVSGGWQVVGTGRRRDRLDELAAELGDFFHPMMLDMCSPDDFGPALAALPQRYRGIDLLLNNAGLAPPMSNLQDAGQEPLDVVIDTNVTGLVALTRTLLPTLIERKGAVINLSSVAATYPYRGGAVYAGTKGVRPPVRTRAALRPRTAPASE